MENAEIFLTKITELVPPGNIQRHNLTVDSDGLILTLTLGEVYLSYTIEGDDMETDPIELAETIHKDIKENNRIEKAREKFARSLTL